MADFTSVRDAVDSLRLLLRQHITLSAEPGIGGVEVELGSPRELELVPAADVISLWLHRVELQPDVLNRSPDRPTAATERPAPVPVELCVQATPLHSDGGTQLLLVGRILQVVSDHRVLAGSDLVGSLAGTATQLRVTVDQLGAYELNMLWSALQTHQRSSVGLRVNGLAVDSHHDDRATEPVVLKTGHVSELVASA
jgi:hypothetical protein